MIEFVSFGLWILGGSFLCWSFWCEWVDGVWWEGFEVGDVIIMGLEDERYWGYGV